MLWENWTSAAGQVDPGREHTGDLTGKGQCDGPGVGLSLVCWRNGKEAGTVRVEIRRKTEERDAVGKAQGPEQGGLFRASAARILGLP